MANGVTLAIRPTPNDKARKVTKIIPYKEGGFAVLTPYHKAREGFVAKLPVDYRHPRDMYIPRAEIVGYTVSDRVKLSYHPDGFAQSSGEIQGKVISGRDPETGEPKGVGLMTHPLDDPIKSGPTFGVGVWGLEDFDELDVQAEALIFDQQDWYYRRCTEETATGWLIEVFAFPMRFWAGVRKRGNRYVISMSFAQYEATNAIIDLIVIPLVGQPIFLAAFASRAPMKFEYATSGWTLNGPGQYDQTGRGYTLNAFYPRAPSMSEDADNLDLTMKQSDTISA